MNCFVLIKNRNSIGTRSNFFRQLMYAMKWLHAGTTMKKPLETVIRSNGLTLIELVVAMVASSLVVSLVLASFVNINKGFHFQMAKVTQIQNMVVAKKRIDKAVSEMAMITSVHFRQIDYATGISGRPRSLRFAGDTLYQDSSVVVNGISDFSWRLERPDTSSRAVFVWEAVAAGSWIGGAAEVIVEDSERGK
jgi:prepilin-type N-terminal cleavage/methylation domain-containing protein